MRAVVIEEGRLVVAERPDPVPGPGEVLIRVRTAGINNADLMQAAGKYPPPPGTTPLDMPGLECAGELAETGQRVMALLPGAGQAELVAVDARHALPVPGCRLAGRGRFHGGVRDRTTLFAQAELRAGERCRQRSVRWFGTRPCSRIALGAEVTERRRTGASRP